MALLHQLGDQVNRQLRELFVEFVIHAHRSAGVIDGSVGVAKDDPELLGERTQAIARSRGQQNRSHLVGVDNGVLLERAEFLKEADIKTDILSQNGMIANKRIKLWEGICQERSVHDHRVGNAGKVGDK